jgi:DNA-directed RNA polymerase subunit K/omega
MSDYESDYEINSSDSEEEREPVKKQIGGVKKPILSKNIDNMNDDASESEEEEEEEQEGGVGEDYNSDEEDDDETVDKEDDEESIIDSDVEDVSIDGELEDVLTEKNSNTNKQSKLKKKIPVKMDHEDEDEDDEYDEHYLQKFDSEITKNYMHEFHPECYMHNYDEITKLCHVVRDSDGIIIDPLHKTVPYLTKFEKARVLGQRAKQIESGAKPFVNIPETIIDGHIISELELKEKKIPFIIRRPIPGGGCEYWYLRDLEIINL